MTRKKSGVKRKSYRSTLRAEQAERTRGAILAAARRLFVEHGYDAMTMQAIASEAGVALDTVYAAVGPKPVLARLLVETAISNRDHAVPANERAYVVAMRGAPRAREKLAIYAHALAEIQPRLAPLVRALAAAAHAHPDLAKMWREIAERRAANMRQLAADLERTGELRADLSVERVADVLWATNAPELYLLLVGDRGWSAAAYGEWLADAWTRMLLA